MNDLSIYREALRLACKALEGYYESCPYYEYDMDMDCEHKCSPIRSNNTAECWEEYFFAKAKGGYKKFSLWDDEGDEQNES